MWQTSSTSVSFCALCLFNYSYCYILLLISHEGLQSRLLLALTTDAPQSSSLRLSKLLPHTVNGVPDFRSCHDGRHTNTCMLKPIWEAALRLAKCCWWLSGWKVWGVSSPEETRRTEMMSGCYDDWQSTYIFPLPRHIIAPSCGCNAWRHKYPNYFFKPKHVWSSLGNLCWLYVTKEIFQSVVINIALIALDWSSYYI